MINEIRNDIKLVESLENTEYPFTWNEKRILWTNGEFYIASGNSTNTYLTLWDSENKNVGLLDSSLIHKEGKKRAKINMVRVKSSAKGNRLGLQLYKTLLEWLPDDVVGIYSYLPDRSNRKEVPKIYNRLGGYIKDEDHAYIDRK